MRITVDLSPETQAQFDLQARLRGLPTREYLRQVLEELGARSVPQAAASQPRASQDEFERALDEFSEGTESLPAVTEWDLTREAMYADHD